MPLTHLYETLSLIPAEILASIQSLCWNLASSEVWQRINHHRQRRRRPRNTYSWKSQNFILQVPWSREAIDNSQQKRWLNKVENLLLGVRNIYVKLPIVPEGLKAQQSPRRRRNSTNMTPVFLITQAWAVAKPGATPWVHLSVVLDDIGQDGVKLVEDIVNLYRLHGYETAGTFASIRSVENINRSARRCWYRILPPKLIDERCSNTISQTRGLRNLWRTSKMKSKIVLQIIWRAIIVLIFFMSLLALCHECMQRVDAKLFSGWKVFMVKLSWS